MKAEELMIGDWVLCDGKHYQIAEIGGMVCLDAEEELFASLEDIEPIPLTPEILEKNGFEYYGKTLVLSDDFYDITMKEWSDTIFVFRYTNSEFGATPFIQVSLCYVHELQHALRLCGINLEIKL